MKFKSYKNFTLRKQLSKYLLKFYQLNRKRNMIFLYKYATDNYLLIQKNKKI